ncbi:1,4-dihydroxy-2-naphthoate polyprenyltransferase [Candidatus Marinamargulisbacteria bacterium SCGC AG-414-C22]|nr:1,4-dihydroxy-2-naphthoate polyprenyltransferase [Candidatus Marinamargulisbacteria bacterium SCGC AG-414-C22]
MKIKNWLYATRPKTLTAGICPVILGLLLAYQQTTLTPIYAIITLLCALLIQIGTNFANDYFDHKKGGDTDKRIGPTRVIQAGLITPKHMKIAMIIAFSTAFILGLTLVYHGGLSILAIGICAILFGILYTGSSFSLAYTGTADIFVLIFFGPVAVAGTTYIQTLSWTIEPIIIGTGIGLISTALLAVNNTRDYDEDKTTNKKTFVVRFGKTSGKWQYTLCLLGAIFILITQTPHSMLHTLIKSLVILITLILIKKMWTFSDHELNKLLALTGSFISIYTIFTLLLYAI